MATGNTLAAVKALTFDVFGTVVDWRQGIAHGAREILAQRGFSRDWHFFAERWRMRYQPAMAKVRSGARPWARLDDLHRENLLAVLKEFEIEGLDEATIDALNRTWHRLDPWPDVVAGLGRLKLKFILAALSNGNVALMINLARHAGLSWDMILGAEIAGAYKPEPAVYDRAASLLDLAPGQCMMVAAHISDLEAARRQGFRTAFVPRPEEWGPKRAATAPQKANFDVRAVNFHELAQHLGC
ncbi:MAG: haloacid dehalogenase type II [Acetobacteraceae bacterium]